MKLCAPLDSCYSRGSSFRLKLFLKDGVSYPKMVRFFFFCVILVVHVGHGMFHPVAASVFSKSVFERGIESSECGGDVKKNVVRRPLS